MRLRRGRPGPGVQVNLGGAVVVVGAARKVPVKARVRMENAVFISARCRD